MKLLEDFDKLFLAELNAYLNCKRRAFERVHTDAPVLIDILTEFMNRKSKHIRPAMFYFACQKGIKPLQGSAVWNIALAIEFVHALALIHDDIIDASALRRGKPTVHESYGINTAILVGDLAITIADELYLDVFGMLHLTNGQQRAINAVFNTFKQETIIGEYLDVTKNKDIYAVMKLKTAQYTFEKPAILGMVLAGKDTAAIKAWSKILLDIGIAFQIYDDFIGSFGQERIIGKSTDSDIKEGKNTVFAQLFLERAGKSDKTRFLSFFGSNKALNTDLLWFRQKSEEYGITNTVRYDIEHRISYINHQIDLLEDTHADFKKIIHAILKKISNFNFLTTYTNEAEVLTPHP